MKKPYSTSVRVNIGSEEEKNRAGVWSDRTGKKQAISIGEVWRSYGWRRFVALFH